MEIKKPKAFELRLNKYNAIHILPHRQLSFHFICGSEDKNIILVEYNLSDRIVWAYIKAWKIVFPETQLMCFDDIKTIINQQFYERFGWYPTITYEHSKLYTYQDYSRYHGN